MTYCGRCDRHFNSWHALEQHENNSSAHNRCNRCDRDFMSRHALEQHWANSSFHSYCQSCDSHFDDDGDLYAHYERQHHWCRDCRQFFVNDYGLSEHYRQSPNHNYCVECKRDFSSENELRNHLNSSVHRTPTIRCTGRGCDKSFISPAAMISHLESGYCPSGVTRAYIDNKVRELDTRNIITNPSRLLTGSQEQVTYYATNQAWNGDAYECYLCHGSFRSLDSLNKHLASPRHQEKMYICPLTACRKNFPILSGLCQHIESGQCGVHKFKVVQNTINSVIGQMNMLTF